MKRFYTRGTLAAHRRVVNHSGDDSSIRVWSEDKKADRTASVIPLTMNHKVVETKLPASAHYGSVALDES